MWPKSNLWQLWIWSHLQLELRMRFVDFELGSLARVHGKTKTHAPSHYRSWVFNKGHKACPNFDTISSCEYYFFILGSNRLDLESRGKIYFKNQLNSSKINIFSAWNCTIKHFIAVEWVFIEMGFHQNGFSSKRVFIKTGFHQNGFSSNGLFIKCTI